MSELTPEALTAALRRAYSLGQIYWQQVDSDRASQHRKADETEARFRALVAEMVAALDRQAGAAPLMLEALNQSALFLARDYLSTNHAAQEVLKVVPAAIAAATEGGEG